MRIRERLRKWNEPKPITVVDRWLIRILMGTMSFMAVIAGLQGIEWCIFRIVS